jgi:hypothetical protein
MNTGCTAVDNRRDGGNTTAKKILDVYIPS